MSTREMMNRWLRRHELAVVADAELGERSYEHDLRGLLRRLRIDCVLDVGANLGQFRERVAQHCGWSGPVVSFEPIGRYCEVLAARGASRREWRVIKAALGARDAEQSITLFDSPGLASLLPARLPAMRELLPKRSVEVVGQEIVQVRRLADLFAEATRGFDAGRVFLKLDTQGYDLEVLEGARPILDRIAAIQSEVSLLPLYDGMPDFVTAFARFKAAGYEPFGLYPVTRDGHERLIEIDCIFVASPGGAAAAAAGAPPPTRT